MTNKPKADSYYRARKTKAVPKHTLFGTALERQDGEDVMQLKNLNEDSIEVEKPYKRRYSYNTLPESEKSVLPGNKVLEHSKEEAEKQHQQAHKARELLKSLEERSLFFQSPNDEKTVRKSVSAVSSRPPQWITEKDIEHAAEVNAVGLGQNNSYDRQRFARKPPVHQYALIGDMMRAREMEFPQINRDGQQACSSPSRRSPNLYYSRVVTGQEPHLKTEKSVLELPLNIRHGFGSRNCDNLLSDPETVHKTMNEQERKRKAINRAGNIDRKAKESIESPVDPAYHALGCALRQDIFPGHTYDHKISSCKDTYTNDVFQRRYQDPEQYRMQRDAVSTWAEHNVLRQRMKKAWAEYFVQPKND